MVFSIQKALSAWEAHHNQSTPREQLDQLREALAKHQTPLRDDSLLAWHFATDQLHPEWRFHDVVFELLLMRFLHEYTAYPEILSRAIAGVDTSDVRMLHDWIIPVIKIKVLQQCPGGLPVTWPWVREKSSAAAAEQTTTNPPTNAAAVHTASPPTQ